MCVKLLYNNFYSISRHVSPFYEVFILRALDLAGYLVQKCTDNSKFEIERLKENVDSDWNGGPKVELIIP